MIHNLHCNKELDCCSQRPCIKRCTLNIHTEVLTLARRLLFVSDYGSTARAIVAKVIYVKNLDTQHYYYVTKRYKLFFSIKYKSVSKMKLVCNKYTSVLISQIMKVKRMTELVPQQPRYFINASPQISIGFQIKKIENSRTSPVFIFDQITMCDFAM